MTTSATSAGFTLARAIASRMTTAARSTADTSLNTPPKDPIGVRQALRMTASSSLATIRQSLLFFNVSRHSFAASNTLVSSSPVARSRRILEDGDQRIERRADLVGVGRRDVAPDVGRAGRQPRRVGQPAAASARPSSPTASPTTCISALAVNCGRWLRNASSRSWASTPTIRGSAPSACTNADSFATASPLPSPVGVSSHGRPRKRSGRACSRPPLAAPASGCPPTNVNRGGRARGGVDDRALRAAGVGHHGRLPDVDRRARREARDSEAPAPRGR